MNGDYEFNTGVASEWPATSLPDFASYFTVGDDYAVDFAGAVPRPGFVEGEVAGIPLGSASDPFSVAGSGTAEILRERGASGIPSSRSSDEESPSMIDRFQKFLDPALDLVTRAIFARAPQTTRGPSGSLSDRVRTETAAAAPAMPSTPWIMAGLGVAVALGLIALVGSRR